jgi:hypothetical protein
MISFIRVPSLVRTTKPKEIEMLTTPGDGVINAEQNKLVMLNGVNQNKMNLIGPQ